MERFMPADRRDDRFGKLERELVYEDAALAGLKEDATWEQLQDWLDRLQQVLQRAKQRQLSSPTTGLSSAPCSRRR
jgi:leucyl aminopeptidase (aminopeptidase T)